MLGWCNASTQCRPHRLIDVIDVGAGGAAKAKPRAAGALLYKQQVGARWAKHGRGHAPRAQPWTGGTLGGRHVSEPLRAGPACSRTTTRQPTITLRHTPALDYQGWRRLLRLTWTPPSACAGDCRGCVRGQLKRREAQRLAHASCMSAAVSPRSVTAGVQCSTPGCAARYRRRSATRLASPQWATAAPKCSLSRRTSGCGHHTTTRCYANSCAAPPGVPAARAAA